jgi:hypothetical protein
MQKRQVIYLSSLLSMKLFGNSYGLAKNAQLLGQALNKWKR